MTQPSVILIGPPGAGKTTVGRLLAERLGVTFADSDELIEQRAGTIREIFAKHGERGFRNLEFDTIADALREGYGVLALGGGAVMHEPTYELLAEVPFIVELVVNSDAATTRIGDTTHRPLLAHAGHQDQSDAADARLTRQEAWTALVSPRLERYRELAALRLHTEHRTPEEIALKIVEWLEPRKDQS